MGGKEYPTKEILDNDIKNENSYVIIENKKIVGTFSLIIGEEETYQKIEGNWHSNKTYGTIHRLASNGKVKGISKTCFDFCLSQINYIRIDTHQNNIAMKKSILKYGFKKCGNIYVKDNSMRIAYDYLK